MTLTVHQLRELDGAAAFLDAARTVGSAVVRSTPGQPTREMALLAGAEIADQHGGAVHAVLEPSLHPFLASWIHENVERPVHLHSPKGASSRILPRSAVLVVITEGGGPDNARYEGDLLLMMGTHPHAVLRDPANTYRAVNRFLTLASRSPARYSFANLRPSRPEPRFPSRTARVR